MRNLLLGVAIAAWLSNVSDAASHQLFRITVGGEATAPVSGRLLVFLTPGASGTADLNASEFSGTKMYVAAKEVRDIPAGGTVELDADDIVYPAGFSTLAAGDYRVQALLDVDHSYNYAGRAPGDLTSDVAPLPGFKPGTGTEPDLMLTKRIPAPAPTPLASGVQAEDFVSPVLTSFYHRPIHMHAVVVEPPDYEASPRRRYPACYFTHGFSGTLRQLRHEANQLHDDMAKGKLSPMFWILLEEASATGTHEFADSANNGPWGRALTSEFIPYLESRYRLDPRVGARFLNGHSSGGWATLWLQVNYPKVFGGTWSTSPDPSDFHDFSGIDLYAPNANVYHRPDGTLYPIVRSEGRVVATVEQFARLEEVIGPIGGQFASFEWVFSPRGEDGRPLQMFHRGSGDVNPDVVTAWKQYDIAAKLRREWPTVAANLNGKIHVYVGTADTFYLDGAAHKLDETIKSLGGRASFTFLPGRSHMNVYQVGDDKGGLFVEISHQMYAVWQASARRPSGGSPSSPR